MPPNSRADDNTAGGPIAGRLVERIHAHPLQLVYAATGGGSGAIAQLLAVGGASRTLLEACVPYSLPALTAWLGAAPEQACSNRTARAMAMAAFQRAQRWVGGADSHHPPLAGVACTASLASDRPKRGPHRIHVAVQTLDATATFDLELNQGARTRTQEERLASALALNAIAAACDCAEAALDLSLLPGEHLVHRQTAAAQAWRRLLSGQATAALTIIGQVDVWEELPVGCAAPLPARVIFPGAFDPLHEGHRGMAQRAEASLGQPVEYELSVSNVDKPALDYLEIERRLAQFPHGTRLWLTAAPTFVEKAGLFPGATFVVGLDTIERIADPRYYRDDVQERDRALRDIGAAGVRFLVFGRTVRGAFQTLGDVALPQRLTALCSAVDAAEFRCDVSSTQLRQSRAER